jgi:hypothetical protein
MRIAARSGVMVLRCEAVGKFIHVERADDDRALLAHAPHERRIGHGGRVAGKHARPRNSRDAGHVEQVLRRERHAGEWWQRLALRTLRIELRGFVERSLHRECRKRIDMPVADFNAAERVVDQFACGEFAACICARDAEGVEWIAGGRHGRYTGAGSSSELSG